MVSCLAPWSLPRKPRLADVRATQGPPVTTRPFTLSRAGKVGSSTSPGQASRAGATAGTRSTVAWQAAGQDGQVGDGAYAAQGSPQKRPRTSKQDVGQRASVCFLAWVPTTRLLTSNQQDTPPRHNTNQQGEAGV